MKTVHIFRAQGTAGNGVEEVTILISDPMPDLAGKAAPAFFASEGAALAQAIWSSCPGGTVDALIAALLARRASMFRVSFDRGGETP